MSSLKAPLLVATGVLIGLAAGFPLGRGLPEEARPEAPRPDSRDAPPTARILELEGELATERASHAARPAGETAAAPVVSAVVAAAGPVAAPPELLPEAIKARLEKVPAEIKGLFKAKDGKGVIALLRELGQLGPLAGKTALGLAFRVAQSIDDDNPIGVNVQDFHKAVRSGDFPELYKVALENPKDYDVTLRRLAARELPWTDLDGVNAIFLTQLATETDRELVGILAEALSERPTQENVDPIADALRVQPNPRVRSMLVQALAAIPGEQATRALATYLPGETDPDVKEDAENSLRARLATVAGYLVTSVREQSQGAIAGIKVGDIVTTFGGKAINSMDDLENAKGNVLPEDQVRIGISRDGQALQVTIKGPRIGIEGRFVQPDAP
jgi:hypothetical protein